MDKPGVQLEEEVLVENHKSKIGTWISVGVVAGVILVSYFVLFGLYMSRV